MKMSVAGYPAWVGPQLAAATSATGTTYGVVVGTVVEVVEVVEVVMIVGVSDADEVVVVATSVAASARGVVPGSVSVGAGSSARGGSEVEEHAARTTARHATRPRTIA